MGRRATRRWLAEHRRDAGVRRAQREGYRSRAAYKLLELDRAHGFIAPARSIVELGAAPGGWTQALARANPAARIVAVDLLEMEPVPGASCLRGDFTEEGVQAQLIEHAGAAVDLLLSDAAPDLSGIADRDATLCEDLHQAVLDCCDALGPGFLLVKSFSGAPLEFLRAAARERFGRVLVKRPQASRARSHECYLLAFK